MPQQQIQEFERSIANLTLQDKVELIGRLAQSIQSEATLPQKESGGPPTSSPIDEVHRQMIADGLIARLPDPSQDVDDDDPEDEPIVVEGEPLSEMIIRERR